jgi:hypothetical protein
MRGDWDLLPENKVEWVGFSIALLIVVLASIWIAR